MLKSELLIPGQFTGVPDIIWQSKLLSPADKLVWICLMSHLGKKKACYPSVKTIVEETGIPKRTVCRSLATLKAAGFIEKNQGFVGFSNHYILKDGNPHQEVSPWCHVGTQTKEVQKKEVPKKCERSEHTFIGTILF